MDCSVIRNDANEITKVLAPNSEESELYKNILELPEIKGDKEKALKTWAQIYTPSFKEWFGDWESDKDNSSKVVDKNGEPLLVYHSTSATFDSFNKQYILEGSFGNGFYFTDSFTSHKDFKGSDKTIPVFLAIKNPFNDNVEKKNHRELPKFNEEVTSTESLQKVKNDHLEFLKNYDGVIAEYKTIEYVVFESNQIKSVFNEGQFSEKSDNIYEQKESIKPKVTDKELDTKMQNIAEKLGFDIKFVDSLEGDMTAKVNMMSKIIDVVQGLAGLDTLSEEIVHAFTSYLPTDSPILKQMQTDIVATNIYADTLAQYKNDKNYRNSDGSINYQKIKKEAIDKLINAYIHENEPEAQEILQNESFEKQKLARTLWNKLWDWIKSLFNKSFKNENPFKEMAKDILGENYSKLDLEKDISDIGTFAQKKKASFTIENVKEELAKTSKDLYLNETINTTTGQKRHEYELLDAEGKVIKTFINSITKIVHADDDFESGREKKEMNAFDLSLAEWGTRNHAYIEHEILSYLNDDLTISDYRKENTFLDKDKIPVGARTKLSLYVAQIMEKYQDIPGVTVHAEQKILDPSYNAGEGLPGTIDLMFIYPDKSYDKYDWKFIRNLKKDGVDDKRKVHFKAQANIQADILKGYGLHDRRIDYMIPFKVVGKTVKNASDEEVFQLTDLEVPSFDYGLLPEEFKYLRPVIVHHAEADALELNKTLELLNATEEHLLKTAGSKLESSLVRVDAKKLEDAIHDIIFRQDVSKLTEVINSEKSTVLNIIKSNNSNLKLNPYITRFEQTYSKLDSFLTSRIQQIEKKLQTSTNEDEKEILRARLKDFRMAISGGMNYKDEWVPGINETLHLINKSAIESTQELSDLVGFGDVAKPELQIGKGLSLFTNPSQVPVITAQIAYQMYHEAISKAMIKETQYFNNLKNYIDKIEEHYKENLINVYEKYLLESDKDGSKILIKPYKKEYFDEFKQAVNSSDIAWFKANTTFDKTRFEEDFDKFDDLISDVVSYGKMSLPEGNKLRREFSEKWNPQEDYSNADALYHEGEYGNRYLLPKEKWNSDKYNELEKQPLLKEFRDYLVSINKTLFDMGELKSYSQIYTFIPGVSNSMVEAYQQKEQLNKADRLKDQFFLTEQEVNAKPDKDPLLGTAIKEIRISYTSEIKDSSKQNKDLGLIYKMLTEEIARVETLSSIEPILEKLLIVESNKKMLEVNRFGKTSNVEVANTKNLDFVKREIEYMLRGQESMPDITRQIKDSNLSRFVGISGLHLSGAKILDFLLTWNSVKRLGFKLSSAASNYIGITGNLSILAKEGIYFTDKQFLKAQQLFISKDKKANVFLKFFNIVSSSEEKEFQRKQIAANTRIGSFSDIALKPMSFTENISLKPGIIALGFSHMLDETNNIVSILKYVAEKFPDFTPQQIANKVDTLSKTQSLFETAILDKKGNIYWNDFDGNKIDISEIQGKLQSPKTQFTRLGKEIINKVSGQPSADDKAGIFKYPGFRILSQFRSFMAGLLTSRFGKTKFSPYSNREVTGRWNLFITEALSSFRTTAQILLSNLGTDKFAPSIVERAKERYKEEKKKYEKETGKEYQQSEAEFIQSFIGSIKSMGRELAFIAGFFTLLALLRPNDDATSDEKARAQFFAKFVKKFYNEFSWYLDPREFAQLFSNSVPLIGLLTDIERFFANLEQEIVGTVTGDQEQIDKAHPLKYGVDLIPLTKQPVEIIALMDEDFRKDWNIRFNKATFY